MATGVPVLPTPLFPDYAAQSLEPHCLTYPPEKTQEFHFLPFDHHALSNHLRSWTRYPLYVLGCADGAYFAEQFS